MAFSTDAPLAPAARRQALTGLGVRNATLDDAPLICDLWNDGVSTRMEAAGGNGIHGWPIDLHSANELVVTHENAGRPLWLATLDGVVVAMLSFYGMSEHPGCEEVCELAIHVRHDRRGEGIGRALLAHAIGFGPEAGYTRYTAYIRSDNAASLGLFRDAGFTCWGRIPGGSRFRSQRLDLVLFGIELDKV